MCVRYPIDPKCLLGRGAFGVVYATRGRKGNAEYALKRYNDVLAENAGTDLILSCIREIFILQQLPEHPSIIRLRDVVVTHNTVDLVLDKALTNLNRVLRWSLDGRQVLTKDHVTEIFHQIISGLCYLHGNGIIHRDLTPSNILIDGDCRVRIADFGAACHELGPLQRPGERFQPLCYRAPELLFGMTWGKVVDMWSTGVLLAEMMVCSEQCTADVNEKRKYFPLMIIPDERAMYQEDQQLRDKTIRRIFEVIPMKDQQFINPQTEDVVYAFRGKALGVHRDAGDTEGFYRVLGKAKNQVMGSVLRGCLMMDWSQRKTSLEVAEMLGMASPPKQAGVKFDLPATYQDYVEVLSSLRAKDSEKENNESE